MSLTLGRRAGAGEGLAVFPRPLARGSREVSLAQPAWRCARSPLFETGFSRGRKGRNVEGQRSLANSIHQAATNTRGEPQELGSGEKADEGPPPLLLAGGLPSSAPSPGKEGAFKRHQQSLRPHGTSPGLALTGPGRGAPHRRASGHCRRSCSGWLGCLPGSCPGWCR